MTYKEASQIGDMYHHYKGKCFICDRSANQRAHIIGDTKLMRLIYGNYIIDDPLDWLPACSLECNKLIDIGRIPSRAELLIAIIESDLDYNDKREKIETLVRENIALKRSKSALI